MYGSEDMHVRYRPIYYWDVNYSVRLAVALQLSCTHDLLCHSVIGYSRVAQYQCLNMTRKLLHNFILVPWAWHMSPVLNYYKYAWWDLIKRWLAVCVVPRPSLLPLAETVRQPKSKSLFHLFTFQAAPKIFAIITWRNAITMSTFEFLGRVRQPFELGSHWYNTLGRLDNHNLGESRAYERINSRYELWEASCYILLMLLFCTVLCIPSILWVQVYKKDPCRNRSKLL